jgi:uncharacterized cupredoxin-like copper-binding protein
MSRIFAAIAASAVIMVAGPALAHGPAEGKGRPAAKPRAAAPEETPFGRAGDPSKVARTIPISMSDAMRYEPAVIRVKAGETVKLVVSNKGQVLHELVLGTMADLEAHAEMMKKHPGMEHDEPYMAHVGPGRHEALVWQFDKPGEFHYGCLLPGHFESGMVGKVIVLPR